MRKVQVGLVMMRPLGKSRASTHSVDDLYSCLDDDRTRHTLNTYQDYFYWKPGDQPQQLLTIM